jgi:hypothetical protein
LSVFLSPFYLSPLLLSFSFLLTSFPILLFFLFSPYVKNFLFTNIQKKASDSEKFKNSFSWE